MSIKLLDIGVTGVQHIVVTEVPQYQQSQWKWCKVPSGQVPAGGADAVWSAGGDGRTAPTPIIS